MSFFIEPNIKDMEDYLNYCEELIILQKLEDNEKFVNQALLKKKEIENESKKSLSNIEIDQLIVKSVTLDLIAQGWKLSIDNRKINVTLPSTSLLEINDIKNLIRKGLLIQRNQQLIEPSVKDFISKCERKRLFHGNWKSIFSLMRDGKEFSEELGKAKRIESTDERNSYLMGVIKPYIQIAEANKKCEFTGMNLLEIWRYFRHTWVTPYKVLPGRSIAILIRDAAAPDHPVIGIGALGSSVAQHTPRDKWIGWESDIFINTIIENPSKKYANLLVSKLKGLINNIYLEDLLSEGIISYDSLVDPNVELIKKLRVLSNEEIKKHRLSSDHSIFNNQKQNDIHSQTNWEKYAKTPLYKSKRLKSLSILLDIKYNFLKSGFITGSKAELVRSLTSTRFKKSVGKLIRMIKSESVGINMMDIIVCGAIAPYNHILGGKLVCSLLTSSEITKYYKQKYKESVSIIASSMAGKKLKRTQDLVLLGTTSLYGVGSSQYNRIKIPLKKLGGNQTDFIEYINLGKSEGYGSFHFSKQSIDLIHARLGRRNDGRRVNSIFGEGANPLMRKLREGLDLVGLPSQKILKHGNSRVVYGVPLAKNFREYLIGLEKSPKYLIPTTNSKLRTEMLSKYWIERWLSNRIKDEKVLEQVSKHTLSYPISHGARIIDMNSDKEWSLF